MGFFDKLKAGLFKTKETVFKPLNNLFKSLRKVDEEFMEELEEVLICADVGYESTEAIIDKLRDRIKEDNLKDSDEILNVLKEIMCDMIGEGAPLNTGSAKPDVILVIGVNGVGKTTSIAKIANNLKKDGKKVILAAADTFRAAAIDQLQIWADRIGVEIIKHGEGADPAAVVFDAANAAKKRNADVKLSLNADDTIFYLENH